MSSLQFDEHKQQALDALRNFELHPFKQILSEVLSNARKVISRNTRTRKLPPELITWMLIMLSYFDSIKEMLQKTWAPLLLSYGRDKIGSIPSGASFSQALEKLPRQFFRSVWHQLVEAFYNQFQEDLSTYKGYTLLAVDGTKNRLYDNQRLRERFGYPTNQTDTDGHPQATILGLVGVVTGFCVDVIIGEYGMSEYHRLRDLIRSRLDWITRNNGLVMLDSGFFGHFNIQWLKQKQVPFLMRAPRNIGYDEVVERIGPGDLMVKRKVSTRASQLDPSLPDKIEFRLIRYQIPGFRPSYLVTNLSPQQMSGDELVGLYHWRWRIEVFFDEIKNTLRTKNIRSRRPQEVEKELFARLIFNNLIRYTMTEAVHETNVPPIRYSFVKSCRIVTASIEQLRPYMTMPGIDRHKKRKAARKIYQNLLQEIREYKVPPSEAEYHDPPDEQYLTPVDQDLIFYEIEEKTNVIHLEHMHKKIA